MEPRPVRIGLRIFSFGVMAFLYIPLAVIVMASFNASRIPTWPIKDYTLHWWSLALHDQTARTALENSFKVGLAATAVALVLGSAAAFALSRYRFFGKNSLSLLLVLPIALPGIVTGLSLLSAIEYLSLTPSLVTVAIGHSTFCIVVVFNNAVARLRRSSSSFEEASMDLGADGWQTFRFITLPNLATALVAGGLLAFALSFDEIVVTNFTAGAQQTLPLWIYNQFRLPNTAQEVNAVAVFVIALTAIPVYLAQRLMRESGGIGGRGLSDSGYGQNALHACLLVTRDGAVEDVGARRHGDGDGGGAAVGDLVALLAHPGALDRDVVADRLRVLGLERDHAGLGCGGGLGEREAGVRDGDADHLAAALWQGGTGGSAA